MHVVLVDDDLDDLEMFCDAVLKVDDTINCSCINSGKEFLAYVDGAETIPDFIFCDLVMPEVDGVGCLRAVRSNDKFKTTKIVAYSSLVHPSFVDAINELEVPVLIKPSSFDEMVERIREILQG